MIKRTLNYALSALCLFGALSVNSSLQAETHTATHSTGVHDLNSSNFKSFIAEGVVIVDFYADWCPPCKKMAPIYREIANELGGKASFGKMNVGNESSFSKSYNVTTIPTFILFRDGKEIKRKGPCSKEELRAWIQSAL